MNYCDSCGKSDRILGISAKCGDLFLAEYNGITYEGYVPEDIGIGKGDYINITFCLECGKIQSSKFPLNEPEFANQEIED
jgi:hypothetical protein